MNSQPFWKLVRREFNTTTLFSALCRRGKFSSLSAWKAVPKSLEFDLDGNYKVRDFDYFRKQIKPHGYLPNSAEFNKGRIADLEIRSLYSHFESFPTVETYLDDDNNRQLHPIALMIYQNMLYLKPDVEADKRIRNSSFLEGGKLLAELISNVKDKAEDDLGIRLDIHSVPKRRVGTFCYTSADNNPIGLAPRQFSFGLERIIPSDRIARELSSYKGAERFVNKTGNVWDLHPAIEPFVQKIRVAVVGMETDLLDSILLYPSARVKLAANMTSINYRNDLDNISPEEQNLTFVSSRGFIEVVHQEIVSYDELTNTMGNLKLSFPCGVKLSGYIDYENQAKDISQKPIDAIIDFKSLAKKGALALFCFKDLNLGRTFTNLDEAIQFFSNLKKEEITCYGQTYRGYILELPVIRTAQRYTTLCKPKEVGLDLISEAILNKKFMVSNRAERQFRTAIEFRETLLEIIREESGTTSKELSGSDSSFLSDIE